jgi:phosphate transport system protein
VIVVPRESLDTLRADLELDCIDLSTRQQPVAPDLRLVAASFEILTDPKRMDSLVRDALAGSSGVITEARIQTNDGSTRSPGEEAVNIYVGADPELGC